VTQPPDGTASLEGLVEAGLLQLDSLHPGGLELTRRLAELCGVRAGADVLDVASGTGETACFLASEFGARVEGVDSSTEMIRRGRDRARARGLDIGFTRADAARLPFPDESFDVVLCECTLCLLDKQRVLAEMVRVVRLGGHVGMHDLCWRPDAPGRVKHALAELEGERPETLEGWRRQFLDAGLVDLQAIDESQAKSTWLRDSHRRLGLWGQIVLAFQVLRRWGPGGLMRVLRSERVFANDALGYGLVVGTRPMVGVPSGAKAS
jgi:SAM-dependent methyltransferase